MNADGMHGDQANGASPTLPVLDARRVDEIESALFAEIARDRRVRRVRRGRIWLGGAAAAAVVVIGAFVVPSVIGGLAATSGGSAVAPQFDSGGSAPDAPAGGGTGSSSTDEGSLPSTGGKAADDDAAGGVREIVTTATATLEANDVRAAIERISAAAVARKGYVEAMSIGTTGVPDGVGTAPSTPSDGVSVQEIAPAPRDGGWVTVRVPAGALPALIADLEGVGKVDASAIDRMDVTTQAVDLRARIEALKASVSRLAELMAKAGSVADLLTAESALSDRQADLESYQQQLKALESQVAMSTLTVTVTPHATVVAANPAGFGDGLAAGWSGFVATLNGLVVAVGFILPWVAVIGVIALVAWAIVLLVRAVRARRRRPAE